MLRGWLWAHYWGRPPSQALDGGMKEKDPAALPWLFWYATLLSVGKPREVKGERRRAWEMMLHSNSYLLRSGVRREHGALSRGGPRTLPSIALFPLSVGEDQRTQDTYSPMCLPSLAPVAHQQPWPEQKLEILMRRSSERSLRTCKWQRLQRGAADEVGDDSLASDRPQDISRN